MSTTQRYQHAKTLLVGEYTPEFAAIFPDLVLLADGAKPRAYKSLEVPVTPEAPDEAPAVAETTKTKAKSA